MGHDFVTYNEHHQLFKDFDLWTLRHFFVEEAHKLEVSRQDESATRLREFFENWEWHGPGVFTGTDFSTYIGESRSKWELAMLLLQKTGDRIAEFGEFIPLSYLEAHINSRTAYYYGEQPTQRFVMAIGRLCTLLSKHQPVAG